MSASKVIADLEAGPPTLNVPQVARILGVSNSGLYEAIRRGEAPIKTIRVLGRIKVITQSVIDLLTGRDDSADTTDSR
ncbi:MAG: helix-turn-helix domain-containing protein [Anaerovoracaceae bacterium]